MNKIKLLIYKEFLIIKKSIILYLTLFLMFPLLLYLFFSIPLSLVFLNMKPIYVIWSSSGIWLISSLFITYLTHSLYLERNYKSESMQSLPILSSHYLFAGYIYAIIISVIELIFSIILTSTMTNDYIPFFDFIKLILIVIPSVVLICNLSYLMNSTCKNNFTKNFFNIVFFLMLSFGFGSFIPLSFFPDSYMNIVLYLPFSSTISNVQNIVSNEPIYYSLIFISIIYAFIFTLLNYFALEKKSYL